jgi:plasmid stability protein
MVDLLVPGVDDALVRELKKRAGANGRSAEAEHRAILAAALLTPPRLSLAELLAGMPDVGLDSDFQRVGDGGDSGEACDVFD